MQNLLARIDMSRRHLSVMMVVFCVLLTACGTGIEMTEHVTDKDVQRVIKEVDSRQPIVTLDAFVDSLPAWKLGKRFWVADNQVRQLFDPAQGYDLDTMQLEGHVLEYGGYDTGGMYDNRMTVNAIFRDTSTGCSMVYRTGKTIGEFRSGFSIPMLIDMDLVDHVSRQVVGKDFYIRTAIWYDRKSKQMLPGRHFIKVHIDSVMPGNAIMPLQVLFTTVDNHERAMVWMSDNGSTMRGRDFDALFVASDPRSGYPDITDANWELITRGQVTEGMTKTECQLALGSPKRIGQNPDQSGMKEYWYYDGGSYLYFVDGLLRQFRR